MKVALLGAPGSGKTKIGKRLIGALKGDTQWTLIDSYVDKLTQRTGLAYAEQANLRDIVQVLGERWTLEDAASLKGHSTITCGSIYETLIYAAAQSMRIPFLGDEVLIAEETYIAEITAAMIAILERRSFDYDVLLYLPLEVSHDDWNGVVDAKLSEVLEGFGRTAFILEGTIKEKVNRGIEIIKAVEKVTSNDQLGVRGGRETGEGTVHPPVDVPDVQQAES